MILTIDERGSKKASVFYCSVFLTIFYLRSSIVLMFLISAYLVCDCSGWVSSVYGILKFKTLLIVGLQGWLVRIANSTLNVANIGLVDLAPHSFSTFLLGGQWPSGRVLDARPKGRVFEPHRHLCMVLFLSKTH